MKTTKDLIEYIKVQTKRGISKNEITETLKEHKWSDEAINNGYKKAKGSKKSQILIILLVLLVIGGGIFYAWNSGLLTNNRKINNQPVEIKEEVIEVIPKKPRMRRIPKEQENTELENQTK